MVLERLTWIPHIWIQMVGLFIFCMMGPVRPLPDDIGIEILTRLTVDCVLECRRVCRKWPALTSSPYFAELHLQRANRTPPSLFLHWLEYGPPMDRDQLNFFIYDKAGGQKAHRRNIITKVRHIWGPMLYHYNAMVVGSCDGLLMFYATRIEFVIFVLDPFTQEPLALPSPYRLTSPCGIYFHSLTHEYKLLFSVCKENRRLQCYYTFSLKSMVCKQLNYFSSYKTRGSPPAILVNGSLHWMVNRSNAFSRTCRDAIMVFGTGTEDFRVLPHPGPKPCSYREEEHINMYLLGTREHLCLCHVLQGQVYVWVLVDYANWVWDRRYKVNLDWDVNRFPFEVLSVLGIHDGELVIAWDSRGVFSYNLEQNTVSKIDFNVEGSCMLPLPYASAYTQTLVRLW